MSVQIHTSFNSPYCRESQLPKHHSHMTMIYPSLLYTKHPLFHIPANKTMSKYMICQCVTWSMCVILRCV